MPISKDLVSGVLFALIGAAAIIAATSYDLGSARRMGPGFFPMLIGGVMIVLGGMLAFGTLRDRVGLKLEMPKTRPLLFILLAVVSFAFLAEPLGLVPSLVLLVVLARFAEPGTRLRDTFVLALLVPPVIAALFVWGLGIPFRIGFW